MCAWLECFLRGCEEKERGKGGEGGDGSQGEAKVEGVWAGGREG